MSVVTAIRRGLDRFMGGRGEHSITVPVMDGALKPNDRLERAKGVALLFEADNAVTTKDRLLVTSGNQIVEVAVDGSTAVHSEYGEPLTCLAVSESGVLAIGLDGTGISIKGGRHDAIQIDRLGSKPFNCPTAAAFIGEDTLIVANGSASFPATKWWHDLLHHGRSGSVTRIDLATRKSTDLATGLSFPAGLCLADATGKRLLISEAWRHRIIAIDAYSSSAATEVLAGLPAYPGRITQALSGGYWLACFAVRSQLQEFVLREDRYRRQMIAEIAPEFWVAPSLSSGRSFKEPLQAGGVIRLGVHKPWAPTRSYGLAIRLDGELQPAWSAHSRADGARHGITSVTEAGGGLILTSKGKGEVIKIAHTALSEPDDVVFASENAA